VSRWPFLVARGRRVGYRVVLAPDFLVRNREHDLLAEYVGAGPAGPGGQSVVEVPSTGFGPLVVTYREEPAAAAELLPGSESDILRDRHGRPLELLYGVVTGSPPEPVDGGDLATARAAAIEAYRRFLADEEGADVQPSAGFTVDAVPPEPGITEVARQDRPVPVRRPVPVEPWRGRSWIVTAAAIVVVVVAVLVGGRVLAGDGEGDGITATETPRPIPEECGDVAASRTPERPAGRDTTRADHVPCR
jgi:hypothetical protein